MSEQTPKPPQPIQTTNQPAQDAVNVIEALTKKGEEAAETAIVIAYPWMGQPILRKIWVAAFEWLINYVMRPVAQLGGHVVIEAEEYLALRGAVAAQTKLSAVKGIGDSNAVAQASHEVDQAVAKVVQYIGATRTH